MREALRAELVRPGLGWRLAALALVLTLPSLWNGLVLDDLWHRRMILYRESVLGPSQGALDMFSFFPDRPELRADLLERGIWPWWGVDNVHVEFFRPVAAITHWLDYQLWPEQPWLMHLHSVLWYGALVVVVAAFLRRFLPAEVAGLAAVFYAVCDGHSLALSWIASRSALIAALFAVLALSFHDRWRRDGWRAGAWLGPLVFVVAILAGELAVGALAFLVAHAIYLDGRRFRPLVPYLLILACWQIGYRLLGYGASGPGIYTDPLGDPLRFALAVMVRLPVLLFSQLVMPFADGWTFMTRSLGYWMAAGAALAVTALLVAGRKHLAASPMAAFLAVGALLALVPVAAVVPSDRVLTLVSVGACGALAWCIQRVHATASSRLARGVATALLLRHVVLAVLFLPVRSLVPRVFGDVMEQAARSAPDDAALASETLVIVNAPHVFFANLLPVIRAEIGGTLPARLRCLGTTIKEVSVERRAEGHLVLRVEGGYLDRPADEISWSAAQPRPAGFRIDLSDMRFEVARATPDGRPEEVHVHFGHGPRPLRWIVWDGDGYRAMELPAVGEEVRLGPIASPLL